MNRLRFTKPLFLVVLCAAFEAQSGDPSGKSSQVPRRGWRIDRLNPYRTKLKRLYPPLQPAENPVRSDLF